MDDDLTLADQMYNKMRGMTRDKCAYLYYKTLFDRLTDEDKRLYFLFDDRRQGAFMEACIKRCMGYVKLYPDV